jgi:hypothetical protein
MQELSLLERASTLLGGNSPIWRGGLEGVAPEIEKEHSEHSRQRREFEPRVYVFAVKHA